MTDMSIYINNQEIKNIADYEVCIEEIFEPQDIIFTINNEFTLKCKTDYQQARALVEYLNRRYKIDD